MPNMDGKVASKLILEKQRSHGQTEAEKNYTKIVFLTSYTNKKLSVEARKIGVLEVFKKPIQV